MTEDSREATITEVARLAGISPATVSRVLNNPDTVNSGVRERVEAAIQTLGYQRKRSKYRPAGLNMLPILIPDIINPYFNQIALGIQAGAEGLDLFPVIINNTFEPDFERKIIEALKKQRLSGVIVCSSDLPPEEWAAFCEETEIPVVMIHRHSDHRLIASIEVDFETAAYWLTRHLLDLNHTRIGYVGTFTGSDFSDLRVRGIRKALQERNLTLEQDWITACLPNSESAFQATHRLLTVRSSSRPTAIIVYNDFIAVNILNALYALKMQVPEDISVASFDDIPLASQARPSLTTVDIPKFRMGRLAMQLLQELRTKPGISGGYVRLDAPVLMRLSTASAPK